jgi:hypothetical protein
MSRRKVEAIIRDTIALLGTGDATPWAVEAAIEAILGKHAAGYVPPLRFERDGTHADLYVRAKQKIA